MDWSDEGIVIATRRHGETSVIVELLTRDHGRHAASFVEGVQGAIVRSSSQEMRCRQNGAPGCPNTLGLSHLSRQKHEPLL